MPNSKEVSMSRIESSNTSASRAESNDNIVAPDEKTKNEFNQLLHAKSQLEKNEKLLKQSEKMLSQKAFHEQGQSMPSPDSLFASLQNNQSNETKLGAAQNMGQTNFDTSQIQEIADRILVATNKDGSQEVRISINDQALAGTEVRINKSLDGQLNIRFETSNANSFQTLVSSQDILKSALETQASNVRIEVSQGSQQGQNQGESRGKMGYFQEDEEMN